MLTLQVTINDFNWPRVDVIITRGGLVKHFNPHHDKLEQELLAAVGDSINKMTAELTQRHNPRVVVDPATTARRN